jgi:hypothetical protein
MEPSFMVMTYRLVVHGLPNPGMEDWPSVTPGKDWSSVYCASKNAYDCGRQGQKLVEGLSLYVRSDHPYLNSELSICLSGEAVRCAEAELGCQGVLEVDANIMIAHQQILVVLLGFIYRLRRENVYFLVYDSTDASLYMMPYLPDTLEAMYTATPVPVRAAGFCGHKLALLALKRWRSRSDVGIGLLCLSTPTSRVGNPREVMVGNPWEVMRQEFQEEKLPRFFSADVLFSVEGKAVWADLSQGLLYSDLGARGDAVVDVLLPTEFQIEYPDSPFAPLPNESRTIGSVDGSIKFVCINDGMVKVLTLDLDSHRWEDEKGFPCPWIELWKQLVSADAKLRNVEPLEPKFPILMPNGALCLLLCDADEQAPIDGQVNYICSFDMRTRTVLTLGRVQDYRPNWPVIFPSDFFRKTNTSPPPPLQKKLRPAVQATPPLKVLSTTTFASYELCDSYFLHCTTTCLVCYTISSISIMQFMLTEPLYQCSCCLNSHTS